MSRPSRARVLVEIERRFGVGNLGGVEPSLYGAYLIEGGAPGDDAAFGEWIDELDDLDELIGEVETFLADPTEPTPTSSDPGSGSSLRSVASGE